MKEDGRAQARPSHGIPMGSGSLVAGHVRGAVACVRALLVRAAMTPAPAMHREALALAAAVVVPVLGAVLRRLRLRLAAGDE